MSSITINGRTFSVSGSGSSVSVINDKVYVNGNLITGDLSGDVRIIWEGDLASLDATSVTVNGYVRGDVDCTNLKCGEVGGNVDATNVTCGSIAGRVDPVTVSRRG